MSEIIASTYEVIERLGSGTGGDVYLAKHLRLGKQVVLKVIKENLKLNLPEEFLRREVDVLKNLNHPHIPRVYDFFVEKGEIYTVMDYIDGKSLDKVLKPGQKVPQKQVVKWARQLLDALAYLHTPVHGVPPRGYVHSDIKPANLMLQKNGDIVLIDFNIALALGEENIVGYTEGYASPEHYGDDYSSEADVTQVRKRYTRRNTNQFTETSTSGKVKLKRIVPDARSDIYSVGATLYHFLKGQRPVKDAKDVVQLSKKEFSPQIVRIITKAMQPNPNYRYQSANDMLYDFTYLRENDPRVKRLKRSYWIAGSLFSLIFASGAASAFVGLKRMQATESWLKLAEYSQNALAEGDIASAINYSLEALPKKDSILEPRCRPEVQRALTKALGIYELADQYQAHGMVELPAAPFYLAIAPDGKTAACVYAYSVAVFDTESAKIILDFPAEKSALAEVEYIDNHRIAYAGAGGITVYDIEQKKELWVGKPATSISISGDKKSIAAVYKDEERAVVYDALSGEVKYTVDFHGKHQKVEVNDSFANPNDNLLVLNFDGTLLGVSFEDGSLWVYDLEDSNQDIELFDETSGYISFEGGFYQEYFAFSATGQSSSVFAVIDTVQVEQTGGFESESAYSVQADNSGIYIMQDNFLVKIHPVTGEQTPLVTTSETILEYARDKNQTLIASQEEIMFFGSDAMLMSKESEEYGSNLLQLAEGIALIGNRDSHNIRIMTYESHPDAEVFSYDPSYLHDEARVSQDGKTVMLFSREGFRLYGIGGGLIHEADIPNTAQVYDQQFIRDEDGSYLEVIYNDGMQVAYSAENGRLLYKKMEKKPDLTLYEEFFTDKLRIESQLHGIPTAYDRKTGRLVSHLGEKDYLTYITQVGEYIVAQYITADGYCYGQLLNGRCEILADLPYLCDVIGETLIFDYPTGNMRKSRIYNINELIETAQDKSKGGS